jgi:hypothetical protein
MFWTKTSARATRAKKGAVKGAVKGAAKTRKVRK